MKKLDKHINLLVPFSEAEEDILITFKTILENDRIYNSHEEIKDIDSVIIGRRRILMFDCLKQAFQLQRHKWSHPTINALFKKIYKEKTKFSSLQLEEISKMINLLNNNLGSSTSLDSMRNYRDDKIRNNPLEAQHKVTDARDVKLSAGGFDSWNAKQTGLTYGKLTINK
jgi:hypothetical protein